ncbi:triphosphoribosyl-dephospho-CoA synthase CitG [Streptococcus chenjunshii]|uniref:Probable 2-(5''-triphosphoribosyl)-3'-dephosphocoenzyme-A synthase n=1 Tax=Streptococcus chenjunshii TaxID=2173853 RepID=A0A372KJI7_9STRE|nr:triphosphoribosyl-dephospho-CoA synthase CitG [Streptococcus chenjunshii]AXQ78323.1 triphosphoribosyl-dephospho-CoA synthase CitG [Streptococcus chenjunshii]RFU50064.1 triphosphoribosyl-dephospho-CoA synthase CitG [Streptococcus chenjunshii]RFU52420.1 triphosphoribosyl-dephospho-CoA synthase CitG [Streptococcus chenjunshii]
MTEPLSRTIAALASTALLYELSLTPKPGLVDRFNNGSHDDMDFPLFIKSSMALFPFFKDYVEAGLNHSGSLQALFEQVRSIGIEAEKAMFEATKGINTHKGANFSFALILSAAGYFLKGHPKSFPLSSEDSSAILKLIPAICSQSMEKDFQQIETQNRETLSYGEKLYLEYGLKGIRGEAAGGYPTLQLLLPMLRYSLEHGSAEEAFHKATIFLMAHVEDGNLIHRGGIAVWQNVKRQSRNALSQNLSSEQTRQWLSDYDRFLIQKHLSPGGTADFLALSYFFIQLEGFL